MEDKQPYLLCGTGCFNHCFSSAIMEIRLGERRWKDEEKKAPAARLG